MKLYISGVKDVSVWGMGEGCSKGLPFVVDSCSREKSAREIVPQNYGGALAPGANPFYATVKRTELSQWFSCSNILDVLLELHKHTLIIIHYKDFGTFLTYHYL